MFEKLIQYDIFVDISSKLNKAEERAHILKGLLIALDHIDEVISIIRASRTAALAKEALMTRFELSDAQHFHAGSDLL